LALENSYAAVTLTKTCACVGDNKLMPTSLIPA